MDHSFQLANTNTAIDSHCSNLCPGEVQLNYTLPIHELTSRGFPRITPFHVQVLCLGIQNQDCSTVYVVQQGDTCSSITGTASISLSTLMANNPPINSDCTNIYPGEVRHRSPI